VQSANSKIQNGVLEVKMSDKKIKVLTLSDHPLSPSGVGTQTKYFIVELLKTGKFQFISLGGAIKHENYQPTKVEEFGDDWVIYPIDGYGNQETIRSILRTQKPDILWFMTDPRFYTWLWEIENEIRSLVPMVYYHVWDNFPYPVFNKVWYDSNDAIATISKLTSNIVKTVSPTVKEKYIPHAVPSNLFTPLSDKDRKQFRKDNFNINDDDYLIFWNSRNARRKQSGSLVFWFNDFLQEFKKKHKGKKAKLLMHTEPNDPNGQDLYAIAKNLGFDDEFLISTTKMPPNQLAALYSAADVTIGISDAEGFGLSTFESLSCETPIIVTMTGGLQEQVTPVKSVSHKSTLKRNSSSDKITVYEHGIGLEPSSKAVIGSQEVPFIYEDRLRGTDVSKAMMMMYDFGKEKRKELGAAGRQHVTENYNFEKFAKSWEQFITKVHKDCGSWENRKNYKSWELIKL
jgi:glycosyltransferase involved in cell wall biosynthesis